MPLTVFRKQGPGAGVAVNGQQKRKLFPRIPAMSRGFIDIPLPAQAVHLGLKPPKSHLLIGAGRAEAAVSNGQPTLEAQGKGHHLPVQRLRLHAGGSRGVRAADLRDGQSIQAALPAPGILLKDRRAIHAQPRSSAPFACSRLRSTASSICSDRRTSQAGITTSSLEQDASRSERMVFSLGQGAAAAS